MDRFDIFPRKQRHVEAEIKIPQVERSAYYINPEPKVGQNMVKGKPLSQEQVVNELKGFKKILMNPK